MRNHLKQRKDDSSVEPLDESGRFCSWVVGCVCKGFIVWIILSIPEQQKVIDDLIARNHTMNQLWKVHIKRDKQFLLINETNIINNQQFPFSILEYDILPSRMYGHYQTGSSGWTFPPVLNWYSVYRGYCERLCRISSINSRIPWTPLLYPLWHPW